MKSDHAQAAVITVNESFSHLAAIVELSKLHMMARSAVHINFTFLPPKVCALCIDSISFLCASCN